MTRAPLSSRVAVAIAHRLPLRVCYWVLIRMGMRYTNGPTRPTEVIPEVRFFTVIERCNAELQGRGVVHRDQVTYKRAFDDGDGTIGMETWVEKR